MNIRDLLKHEKDNTNAVLSTEMIAFQENDYFVSEANMVFEKMITLIKDKNLTGSKFYKDRDGKILLAKLDSLIYDRFGMKSKQIYNTGYGYGVLVPAPNNFNIINSVYKNFKTNKKLADKIDKNKPLKDITILSQDQDVIVKKWVEGISKLNDTLYEQGVYVDKVKARIDNLPKEYILFCISDIPMMVNRFGLSSDELTGIILHEIGHAFTHIEYSIFTVRTTSSMIDTIRENLETKNKSYTETLRLVYETVLEGDAKEVEDTNAVTVTLKVMDKYMKETMNLTKNTRVSTNSEQLADEFASRFGVGEALVSGLGKITVNITQTELDVASVMIITEMVLMFLFLLISTGSIVAVFSGLSAYIIASFVIGVIVSFYSSIVTGGKTKEIKTYEDIKRRYQEIRNVMIKQLRNGVPKEQLPSVLESINRVDAFISMAMPDDTTLSALDKIIRTFSFDAKNHVEISKVDDLIEDLMSNDLYLASARMKVMK